jgi:inhibitor of cysteine peptidase
MRRASFAPLMIAALLGWTCQAADVPVGSDQNGKTITVAPGDSIVITLSGNPTTGFQWTVAGKPGPALEQVGEVEYKPSAARPGVVGSGGAFVVRFKAAEAGQATVKMAYARSWESVPPAQTFEVTVVVQK